MTLNQLMILMAVAEHLNITVASRALHISQPSASEQLKLLQQEFQVRIYERKGRGIELTPAGRVFLNHARAISTEVEKLRETFHADLAAPKTESLVVGGSYSPSASFLPLLLARFRKSHPLVDLTLRTASRETLERLVAKGDVEIALVSNTPRSPFVAVAPYRQEKLVAFVSVRHPLSRKRGLTLPDISGTPIAIRAGKGMTERILRRLVGRETNPGIAIRCDSHDAVKTVVRVKMGLGILYEDVVWAEIKRGDFKVIKLPELNLEGQSFIIQHKDKPLSPNAKDFLALLHEYRGKRGQRGQAAFPSKKPLSS
jgi:DNA-binding transcriptional LysR family regulator